jgi:hypothetical protein
LIRFDESALSQNVVDRAAQVSHAFAVNNPEAMNPNLMAFFNPGFDDPSNMPWGETVQIQFRPNRYPDRFILHSPNSRYIHIRIRDYFFFSHRVSLSHPRSPINVQKTDNFCLSARRSPRQPGKNILSDYDPFSS